MADTPALRPSTPRHPQPLAARLGALAAVGILLAACAGTGPTPGISARPDTTPFASGAPVPTRRPIPSGGPGLSSGPTWTPVSLTVPAPVARLEPTRTVAAGVPLNAAFRLTSLRGEDAVALARGLTAEPPVQLAVSRAGDGAALVTPAQPLQRSTLYRFTLTGPDGTVQGSWPMQTVRDLRIVHAIPDDEADSVPVTTGIEITFNTDGVLLSDVERYLSIEPKVAGHLEQAGRSVAFVPDAPLAPATRYHVEVRAGLPLAGTDQVLEEQLDLRFVTSGITKPGLSVGFRRNLVEAGTEDKAIFPIYVARPYDEDDEPIADMPARIGVKVHRLPGMAEAITGWRTLGENWWDTESSGAIIDTSALPIVIDASVKLHDFGPTQDDYDDSRWFRLPTTLPAGWYVATVEVPGSDSQAVLQVTDVAVYAMTTTTRTLVWANDLATGKPLEGARASLGDTALGRTDDRGIVQASVAASSVDDETSTRESPVVVVRDGDRAAFVAAGDPECGKCISDGGNPWWRLFQLDRARYRTTDTVVGWGVVRAREDRSVPDTVTARLTNWDDWNEIEIPIAETTVSPDANGAFLVKLPLEDVPPGDYSVELKVGDDSVASAYLTVGEILKPAWSVEVTPRRHAVIAGGQLGVDVHAAFYEGTPVGGTTIKAGQHKPYARVTTDLEGNASARIGIKVKRDEAWESAWWVTTVNAVPVDPEEAQIGGSAEVAVFRASVLPVVDAVATAERLTITGRVHDVAFDRFEAAPAEGIRGVDPYGAPRSGATVDVRVRKHTWTTTRVGSTYDFISKETIPVYQTRERVVDLGTRTLRSNAAGRFRLVLPVSGAADGYEVIVTAYDSRNRSVKVKTWGDAPFTESAPDLRAHLEGPGTWEYPTELSIGEKARVVFAGGSGSTAASRYLWTVSQSGLRAVVVTTQPSVSLGFKGAWIPTGHVNAVRFTGHGYEVPDNTVPLVFDTGDRRLTVTMTADQQRYRPGDTATISIHVRGPDGSPVPASVYVRAIDEKLFAIGAASVEDPVPQLYADDGAGVLGIGWTHHDPRPINEGGGGDTTGGPGERENFRDWLVNTIVTADAQGKATVSFVVSDDLTSWRIVGEAVSRDLSLGSGIVSIPVSIPFFAEATVAPSYQVADHPIVSARGFGGGMTADTDVRFTFSSDSLGLAPTTVTAKAFRPAEIALPTLTPGTHSLRIVAETAIGEGTRTDVLVRSFEVVGPRAVMATTTAAPLTGRTAVAKGDGFTTLVISDAGRGRVIPILQQLVDVTPSRGDSALAAGVARQVLADSFGIDDGGTAPVISGFMNYDGYSIVPWGSGDIPLTALALMSGDPRVRGNSWWLEEADPGSREGDLYALAGRAADGAPVLDDIRGWLAIPNLTVAEQVALGLAFVAAGDEDGARQVERELIQRHAQRSGPWVRIVGGGSQGDALITARSAIIAAWLGDPVAADMDAFIVDNPPTDRLLDLERALAAAAWVDRMPASTASAKLTVDGTTRTLDVTGGKAATVVLTPAQAAGSVIEPGSGSVLVTTRVAVPVASGDLEPVPGLAIARTISPSDGIDATDRVRVTLRVEAPVLGGGSCWMVTETVPSGLRPIVGMADEDDDEDDGAGTAEPWSVEGQQLRWCVARDPHTGASPSITYLARVLTAGTYTWEPAVVQSALAPEQGMVLPATTVTIRGLTGG